MIFNISKLRKDLITKRVIQLDLNLDEVAKLTGTSKATLSRIENGRIPDMQTFANIVGWLGTKPNRYFTTPIKLDSKKLILPETKPSLIRK